MLPVFNHTYGLSLLTFGIFVAAALLAAVTMFRQEAKTAGCDPQRIDGLCAWMLMAAIIGARLFYFISRPDAMAGDVLEVLRIWNGGVSLAGGAAVAAAVGFGYTRSFKMQLHRTLDALAPAIAIGQFFAWLGCFFSGFCRQLPAAPADIANAVLSNPHAAVKVQLHPTALFIAAGHFVIFGILLLAKQRRRFSGQTFWLYVFLFAVLAVAVNIITEGHTSAGISSLPAAVIVYAALAAIAAMVLLILARRGGSDEEERLEVYRRH